MGVLTPFSGSLATALGRFFDPKIRERGRRYFDGGAVEIESTGKTTLDAVVEGQDYYEVTLERSGSRLIVECVCPFASDKSELCKHIYATLLAADEIRFGAAGPLPTSIELHTFGSTVPSRPRSIPRPEPAWKRQMRSVAVQSSQVRAPAGERVNDWQITYAIQPARTSHLLTIGITYVRPRAKGGWTKPQPLRMERANVQRLPRADDREILALLAVRETWTYGMPSDRIDLSLFSIADVSYEYVLPRLCATQRFVRSDDADSAPLVWDERVWRLVPRVVRDDEAQEYRVTTTIECNDERVDAGNAIIHPAGIVVAGNRIARFDDRGLGALATTLRMDGAIRIPFDDGEAFVASVLALPIPSAFEMPPELQWTVERRPPTPALQLRRSTWSDRYEGELRFDYGGIVVDARDGSANILAGSRRVIERDRDGERAAADLLGALGATTHQHDWIIPQSRLVRVVSRLLQQKWRIETDGARWRRFDDFEINVSSGIDWFEVRGGAQFEDQHVSLPAVLDAMKKEQDTIRLDDGSIGIVDPSLREHLPLLGLGTAQAGVLRFSRAQLPLIDALLAARPEATADAQVEHAVSRLRTFGGVAPREAPPGFRGELREYQKQALGWFEFLEEFSFGGCLADDMGLGKTVQTLALLERRRTVAEDRRPSLVVMPRSLIFNWKDEAARFAPSLRILDHTGASRQSGSAHFEDVDVVLTTYGTLRRDAAHFADAEFDYVILDEAQAIKNARSQTAKAARLLRGRHRLALSGTPVENHIGELWSLFEFLNPGLLGRSNAFQLLRGNTADEEARRLVARAVRPFILRRTKEQVASELPRKIEQTVWCELEPHQRKIYDALRVEYARSLRARIDSVGVARAKIQILEALLRLRQAACDARLLPATTRGSETGAKIEALMPQLEEIIAEGHKTLVFSQFVSMLTLVREELDRRKIAYVYLDGKTRDRAGVVEQFQTHDAARVFLISLKAGGQGLNLTAADYVFLLDPWWNPAVEAQAIDRTHRIGQTRPVFAYRLVARNTVEEKILELQASKRALADAILTEDKSLIGGLNADDIALLLG